MRLYFLFSYESELLNNESEKIGSELGSSGKYYFFAFSLCAEDYVASAFASNVFAPTGIESKGG